MSRHPGGYRASNRLDRQTREMNRSFDASRHLQGWREACRKHRRVWALLWNIAPCHPVTTRENQD
ncbi:MAG: hypothetical protein JO252_22055 [Planctomycetaceae bacterium]|nr:hypothetical protein [Planctomycetaceae bacterium]